MKTKTKRNHKSNVCNKFDTRKKLAIYIYLKKKNKSYKTRWTNLCGIESLLS